MLSLKVRRRSPIYRLGGEGVHGLSPSRAHRRGPDDPDGGPDDPGVGGPDDPGVRPNDPPLSSRLRVSSGTLAGSSEWSSGSSG